MLTSLSRIFLFLATSVWAQTPPGVFPRTADHLDVYFPDYGSLRCPGCPLLPEYANHAPRLALKQNRSCWGGNYLVTMIDIDLLVSGYNSHLLHWYQPDLLLDYESGELYTDPCSKKQMAIYGGPQPPAGAIHRYVFLLFKQPEGYELPRQFASYLQPTAASRLFFNITNFMSAAGLDAPMAANYFTVSGGASPQIQTLTAHLQASDLNALVAEAERTHHGTILKD